MKYLIGLALLAGIVWYFVSEPFLQKLIKHMKKTQRGTQKQL